MNRKYIAALAVALLVLTAGCAGILGDDSATEPIDDGTDAETPDESGLSEFQYPDGTSSDGVETDTLIENHNEQVNSFSSLTVSTERIVEGEEQQFSDTSVAKFSDNMGVVNADTTMSNQQKWTDGDVVYVQNTDGDTNRYYKSETPINWQNTFQMNQLGLLLENAEFEAVETTEMNGETVVKYESTSVDANALSQNVFAAGEPSDITINLYVGESGVVHTYSYSVTMAQGDRSLPMNHTLELSAFDSTTVETPGWVETAPDTAVSMSVDRTDSYVALTMDNGASIPAGSQLFVGSASQVSEIDLDESFDVGDTMYIYVTADGELQNSYTAPTGDTQPVNGYVAFYAGQHNNLVAYDLRTTVNQQPPDDGH